jgi:hypothetical protein
MGAPQARAPLLLTRLAAVTSSWRHGCGFVIHALRVTQHRSTRPVSGVRVTRRSHEIPGIGITWTILATLSMWGQGFLSFDVDPSLLDALGTCRNPTREQTGSLVSERSPG